MVQDVNRQVWAGSTSALIHHSEHYIGLRTQRSFVAQDKPFEVEVVVVDLDGTTVPGRNVELVLEQRSDTWIAGVNTEHWR